MHTYEVHPRKDHPGVDLISDKAAPMTTIVFWLILISVVLHGIIAGLSFDKVLVNLPTRKRIGSVAYATFARGNDLGNGKVVYPFMGVLALITVFGTTITAFVENTTQAVMLPLYTAVITTIAHSLCTAKAAPIMLSLKDTPDEEQVLTKKLDAFAFWSAWRAVFQISTFIILVWALVKVV
jgi:hypothetical protein